jgi:hypothetical protein
MSAIANQKFNQLYLQGYQPTRTQEPEDPAPYNAPCQQEAAKKTCFAPIPDPQPLPSSLLKKNGGMIEQ